MPIRSVPARRLGAIPLPEVSGLARGRDASGRDAILAIGDRAGTVAWAALGEGLDGLAWQTLDLRHAEGTRIPEHDPQLEAVAVDGRMTVVLVQESPNRAEVIDAPSRRVRAHISFVVPDVAQLSDIRAAWLDPEGSHTEGVVLMREGHIMLVKEKDLENTSYEFTLEDGTVITAKGNEEIEYDGELHTAANLYDALKEGYYGKF